MRRELLLILNVLLLVLILFLLEFLLFLAMNVPFLDNVRGFDAILDCADGFFLGLFRFLLDCFHFVLEVDHFRLGLTRALLIRYLCFSARSDYGPALGNRCCNCNKFCFVRVDRSAILGGAHLRRYFDLFLLELGQFRLRLFYYLL